MSRRDSSGPAFPRTGFSPDTAGVHKDDLAAVFSAATTPQPGMTLRDWFAGRALTGLLAWSPSDGDYPMAARTAARSAYEMADAMLQQRDAPPRADAVGASPPVFDFDIPPIPQVDNRDLPL